MFYIHFSNIYIKEKKIIFHNYSFRVVIIIGVTIDAAVVAVVEVVGVITADGLTADLAKLFRATLSFLQ